MTKIIANFYRFEFGVSRIRCLELRVPTYLPLLRSRVEIGRKRPSPDAAADCRTVPAFALRRASRRALRRAHSRDVGGR